jgi:hypothetical protein
MKKAVLVLIVLAASMLVSRKSEAQQGWADCIAARHAQTMSWHGPYYNRWWGGPVAVVVPPTAHMQTNWGWGVSQTTVTPIYHQFRRQYPGAIGGDVNALLPTPMWPSHTSQFGYYYVRGPY